jgi:hypothetical protein
MRMLLSAALSAFVVANLSQAGTITYVTSLSGANESPANNSAGTGAATVVYDNVAHTLQVTVSFSGLTGTTTASHIHCCTAAPLTGTAGVATTTPTFANFPLGVTSGTYNNTLDLTQASSWNPAFVTANGGTTATAEAVLATGLNAGTTYLNVHSSFATGGEIRGFLVPTPEPSTALLTLFPAAALWLRRRARRS